MAGGAVLAARNPPRGAAGPLQTLVRPVRRPLQLLRPPLHPVYLTRSVLYLISQSVFFRRRQFPHISVIVSFTTTDTKNKLTDLCGN